MGAMVNSMLLSASLGLPATFDVEAFLTNSITKLKAWGGLLIILIGVVMMVVAIWKIGSGLISHGKKQVSWAVCIIMLILGGALASFGLSGTNAWAWVQGIAEGGKNTIDDLGSGGGAGGGAGGGGGGGATPTIIHWVE